LVHLRPPEVCCKVRFDRFSPYFTQSDQFNLRHRHTHAAYGYVYPFEEETLARMAYYFEYEFDGKEDIEGYCKPAVDLINAWQAADGTAMLDAHIQGDEILLVDTRFAETKEYRLKGIERDVYLFCDEMRSIASIIGNYPQYSEESIQSSLELFMVHRLMAHESNSYLSLAVLRGEAFPKLEQLPKQLTVLG